MDRLKTFAGIVIFMVFSAGAALALPTSGFDLASTDPEESVEDAALQEALEEVEVADTVEGETTDVTVPDDTDEGDDDSAKPENHGKAVSTAAHCDIKGRAHGELVRSIAHDKAATAESAQAACDAAIAAAAVAETTAGSKGKPVKAAKVRPTTKASRAKPVSPGQAKKATVEETATVEAASTTEVDSASSSGGPPAGKGNPHKP